jgi:CheY-like chemotaxis protein
MTKRKTILVADDDPDVRMQLALALGAAGFEVLEAEGQESAEEALLKSHPDLCIFDLMMEEMDSGFVLCHEAKRTFPDTPVILLTAVTSQTGIDFTSQTPEQRAWVKADLLLHKPVLSEQLVAKVRQLLAAREGSAAGAR